MSFTCVVLKCATVELTALPMTLGVKDYIKRMVFRGAERELPLLQPVKI